MAKRGVIFLHEPRADMARRVTRDGATRAHADACVALMWRGRVAGPRELITCIYNLISYPN